MEKTTSQEPYAGFVSRAIAFVIDLVVMAVALTVVIGLTESLLGFFTLYGLVGTRVMASGPFRAALEVGVAVIGAGIAIGYPIGFWVLLGQTPGKWLMGVRVSGVTGQPLSFRRAALRYLGYWLSALPLGLGFLWILLDDRRQGWHDKLAGTCVLYDTESTHHRQPA